MAITRINPKLKLNKFEMSVLPHARKLVSTFGYAVSPSTMYSGDTSSPTHTPSKVEAIQEGMQQVYDSAAEVNKSN